MQFLHSSHQPKHSPSQSLWDAKNFKLTTQSSNSSDLLFSYCVVFEWLHRLPPVNNRCEGIVEIELTGEDIFQYLHRVGIHRWVGEAVQDVYN
jgi:hypothetical protein